MPLYEYYCGHCGKEFDLRRQASDAGEPGRCPVCGTEADRLVSAFASKVGFYLKTTSVGAFRPPGEREPTG